jgi:hypothetical protein
LSISDAVLKEVRRRAAAQGRPFRQVLEEMISLGLAASNQPSKKRRIRIKPHALGLKPTFHHLSLNQMFDQFEAEQTVTKGRR